MAARTGFFSQNGFQMNLLENSARNALLSLLERLGGSKVVIWDPGLMGPVTLLRMGRQLKEKELNVVKMHSLLPDAFPLVQAQHVIFIVRPYLSQMDLVADYVHAISRDDRKSQIRAEFTILFIPRVSQMCERRLQNKGVLGSVDRKSTNIYFFPFDTDLMSMEIDHTFSDLYVEEDPSTLLDAAIALKELNVEYGPFSHIIGRGSAAKTVAQHYMQMIGTEKKIPCGNPAIHHVVLIDRKLDMITPLATQLTYEGLIDEIFGLKNTTASFPSQRFSKDDDNELMSRMVKQSSVVVTLNSGDELYAELRDKSFNAIGHVLRKKAQMVTTQMEKRHDKTVENMRKFVTELPQIQAAKRALGLHTTIAELVKEHTENPDFWDSLQTQQEILCAMDTDRPVQTILCALYKKWPILQVLRLICLQSLVNGGLKQKTLEIYKKELVQAYGIHVLVPLSNLEKAGLLKPFSSPRNYVALKKVLRLIVEDDSEINPTDICYTHSIYAPLSARLVHSFRQWSSQKDVADLVGGPMVDHILGKLPNNDERQVVLVFFLGGCTYSEISALRFLSQKEDSQIDYIIATTKLINGNSFLESVMSARNFPFSAKT